MSSIGFSYTPDLVPFLEIIPDTVYNFTYRKKQMPVILMKVAIFRYCDRTKLIGYIFQSRLHYMVVEYLSPVVTINTLALWPYNVAKKT